MKLWILKPRNDLTEDSNPWVPWYNKCFGFVIRAKSEERARHVASEESSAEGKECWLNSKYSDCKELMKTGGEELILQDISNA